MTAGKVFRQEYDLEYGSDCIEMHIEAVEAGERALVVDDLIATGGTLCAAMNLLGKPFYDSLDVDRTLVQENSNGIWLI